MRWHILQLNLRARKDVEIQSKVNPREGCKERDGTGGMTGKENEQDSRTWAVYKQGKTASVRV